MIREAVTLTQLLEIKEKCILSELENEIVFEQRMRILARLIKWNRENEAMELEESISDSSTPDTGKKFIEDWMNDEPFVQEGCGKKGI